jgi:hypothetical protein
MLGLKTQSLESKPYRMLVTERFRLKELDERESVELVSD